MQTAFHMNVLTVAAAIRRPPSKAAANKLTDETADAVRTFRRIGEQQTHPGEWPVDVRVTAALFFWRHDRDEA